MLIAEWMRRPPRWMLNNSNWGCYWLAVHVMVISNERWLDSNWSGSFLSVWKFNLPVWWKKIRCARKTNSSSPRQWLLLLFFSRMSWYNQPSIPKIERKSLKQRKKRRQNKQKASNSINGSNRTKWIPLNFQFCVYSYTWQIILDIFFSLSPDFVFACNKINKWATTIRRKFGFRCLFFELDANSEWMRNSVVEEVCYFFSFSFWFSCSRFVFARRVWHVY